MHVQLLRLLFTPTNSELALLRSKTYSLELTKTFAEAVYKSYKSTFAEAVYKAEMGAWVSGIQ